MISLGRGCQPAHQICRIRGTAAAHVFDWIVTPDRALVTHIASDLDGFFDRDSLVLGPEGCVIDRASRTQFIHEFPAGADIDVAHAGHAARFAHLVERWRALMASHERVLFVRQHAWDPDARATATHLRDTLARQAPQLPFTLLYLTAAEQDDTPWGEPRILNLRLTQTEPYDWRGDDGSWERVLTDAERVEW